MNLKRIYIFLIGMATCLFLAGPALGMPTYFDFGTDVDGDGDGGSTDPFIALQYFGNTTSTQYDTNMDGTLSVGDIFYDDGNAYITKLISIVLTSLIVSSHFILRNRKKFMFT